jgi:hypothetical protein
VSLRYDDVAIGGLSIRKIHERLYAGRILRVAHSPEMECIVALTRGFLEDRLHPHAPQEVHRHFEPGVLAEQIAIVQRDYTRSETIKAAWRELFVAVGFDPERVARDRLMVRFHLHRDPEQTEQWVRGASTVGFHRDTWGTNLYSQVNWWAPVYPITAERTFAFFPELWNRPVANSSAAFDMAEAMQLVRARTRRPEPGEIVPQPLETFDLNDARPVVFDCGGIIAFSSQHAHAGIPNHSGLTRISLETRTLMIDDFLSGCGAPNIDGRARWVSPGLFRRLSDGMPLAEILGVDKLVPFQGPWPE